MAVKKKVLPPKRKFVEQEDDLNPLDELDVQEYMVQDEQNESSLDGELSSQEKVPLDPQNAWVDDMFDEINGSKNAKEMYGVFANPKMQNMVRQAANVVSSMERANGIGNSEMDGMQLSDELSVDEINVLNDRPLPSIAYSMGLDQVDLDVGASRALPSMGESLLSQSDFDSSFEFGS